MKPFLPLSEKTRMEMEEGYPFFVSVRDSVLDALNKFDKGERKRDVFHALRRTEASMSSELSRLRTKPNRATKFAIYMKRTIAMLKLSLDALPDEEQVEAYPTLAVICTHFVNIILPSSLKATNLPKFVACHLYSFLKTVFSNDLEFVLDVLVCSNVFEDAEGAEGSSSSGHSIGFYILIEAMLDGYLYSHDTPAFAKYLTILSFINEITGGGDEGLLRTISDLDSQTVFLPGDVKSHLEANFGIVVTSSKKGRKQGGESSWKEIIRKIKPRKIASITRQQRLVVVSAKRCGRIQRKPSFSGDLFKNDSEPGFNFNPGSFPAKAAAATPLFFVDRGGSGSVGGEEESQVSQVSSSGGGGGGGAYYTKYESDSDHDYGQQRSKVLDVDFDPYKLLPPWVEDDEDGVQMDEEKATQKKSSSPRGRKSRKRGLSEDSMSMSTEIKDSLPRLSPRKSFVDSPPISGDEFADEAEKPLTDSEDSDEDLQVVFVEKATPRKSLHNSSTRSKHNVIESSSESEDGGSESDQESRDFAPSESGEDEIPEYSAEDYCYPGGMDTTGTTITDDNQEEEDEQVEVEEKKVEVFEQSQSQGEQMEVDEAEVGSISSTVFVENSGKSRSGRRSGLDPKNPQVSSSSSSSSSPISRKSRQQQNHDDAVDTSEEKSPPKRKRISFQNDGSPTKSPEKTPISKSPTRNSPRNSADTTTKPVSPTRSPSPSKVSTPDLVLNKSSVVNTSPRRLRTRSDSGSTVTLTPVKKNNPKGKGKKDAKLAPLTEEPAAAVAAPSRDTSSPPKRGGKAGRKSTTAVAPVTEVSKGQGRTGRGRKSVGVAAAEPATEDKTEEKTKTIIKSPSKTPPPAKRPTRGQKGLAVGGAVDVADSQSVTATAGGGKGKGRTTKKTPKKEITPTNLRTTRSTRARAAKSTK